MPAIHGVSALAKAVEKKFKPLVITILDARGAISVTERVGVIARVRALAVGIAKAWVDQQKDEPEPSKDENEPAPQKIVAHFAPAAP